MPNGKFLSSVSKTCQNCSFFTLHIRQLTFMALRNTNNQQTEKAGSSSWTSASRTEATKQNLENSLVRLQSCQFHLNICDNEELRVRCILMLLYLLNCGKLFRAVEKTYLALNLLLSSHSQLPDNS